MKTNFSGFLRQNSGLHFKKIVALASAQRSGMGHKALVLGQRVAQGLCVCDRPCRKPSDPSATIGLLATAIPAFPPSPPHGHSRVSLASLHPPSPCRHPRQQHRAGGAALLEASAGTARFLLSKWTGEESWLLSFSFSLALISPPFCTDCMKLRQKLVVPL